MREILHQVFSALYGMGGFLLAAYSLRNAALASRDFTESEAPGEVSAWEHSICLPCWYEKFPFHDPTVSVSRVGKDSKCCYCESPTDDGIGIREDPAKVACGGKHL